MVRRAFAMAAAAGLSLALACCLAGCQSIPTGGVTRSMAQMDVAGWTTEAVNAVGGPARSAHTNSAHTDSAHTELNAFETCRSDHGYIPTTSQWRTITNVDVAAADQTGATRSIETAFVDDHWRVIRTGWLVTMTGPDTQKTRGLITIQSGGSTQLAISVVSPCYG